MGFNRCGYFAKNGKQKEDSTETEEGDRLSGSSKKGAKNPRQTSRFPGVEWWEMLNWEEMKDTYENLPQNIKEKIRERGLHSRGDKER